MNHLNRMERRDLVHVGRQLARIGDEVNRKYCLDDIEAVWQVLPESVRARVRCRRNVKRLARLLLNGGGLNMGVFIMVQVFWFGYHGNR